LPLRFAYSIYFPIEANETPTGAETNDVPAVIVDEAARQAALTARPADWPPADARSFIRILVDTKKADGKSYLPLSYKRVLSWDELGSFQKATCVKCWNSLPALLKQQIKIKIITYDDSVNASTDWNMHDWARLIHCWADPRWAALIQKMCTPKTRLVLDMKGSSTAKDICPWEIFATDAFNDLSVVYENPCVIYDEYDKTVMHCAVGHTKSFIHCKSWDPTSLDRPIRSGDVLKDKMRDIKTIYPCHDNKTKETFSIPNMTHYLLHFYMEHDI
jgi:hypothetical protein